MAGASRRADRAHVRNALFAVATAERPPDELCERADLVTVTMPWGSLLRGALGRDDAVMAGVAALLRTGGELEILLSMEPRDGAEQSLTEADLDRAAMGWANHGVEVGRAEPATPTDVAASHSTWARRLLAGRPRTIWRLTATRR